MTTKKLKKYKVWYSFLGTGQVEIEAENKEEVKDFFFEGQFYGETETGQDYEIDNVEELKK